MPRGPRPLLREVRFLPRDRRRQRRGRARDRRRLQQQRRQHSRAPRERWLCSDAGALPDHDPRRSAHALGRRVQRAPEDLEEPPAHAKFLFATTAPRRSPTRSDRDAKSTNSGGSRRRPSRRGSPGSVSSRRSRPARGPSPRSPGSRAAACAIVCLCWTSSWPTPATPRPRRISRGSPAWRARGGRRGRRRRDRGRSPGIVASRRGARRRRGAGRARRSAPRAFPERARGRALRRRHRRDRGEPRAARQARGPSEAMRRRSSRGDPPIFGLRAREGALAEPLVRAAVESALLSASRSGEVAIDSALLERLEALERKLGSDGEGWRRCKASPVQAAVPPAARAAAAPMSPAPFRSALARAETTATIPPAGASAVPARRERRRPRRRPLPLRRSTTSRSSPGVQRAAELVRGRIMGRMPAAKPSTNPSKTNSNET